MNSRIRSVGAVSALLFVVIAASCGGDTPTTTRIAAADGGTVIASSFRVTIPALSLATDTEVTLETASADAYPALAGGLSEVLLMRPEGTVLERAASVTIGGDFIDAPTGANVSVSQLATGDGAPGWLPLESSRDAATGDVTVSVTRFAPLGVAVVEASATGGITGTIHWGDHMPVGMAPIQLFRGATAVTTTTSDAAGVFSFTGLEPGDYRLVVEFECMLDRAITVTAGANATTALILCGG